MAQKPAVEQLEQALGERAVVLSVSIHTDLGRELGQRYGFEYTPLFIVFDGAGAEIWRGSYTPAITTVLKSR